MQVSSVGEHIGVGADMNPDATANYDLVVLASDGHQHIGQKYPTGTTVLRCPLRDFDEPPSISEIKRAMAAAAMVAYTANPSSVEYAVWSKIQASDKSPHPDVSGVTPKPVLVCCEEGMNRSLWIAGMALVLTREQPTGKAARQWLEKIRGPEAFHNVHLKSHLDAFYPESLSKLRPSVAG